MLLIIAEATQQAEKETRRADDLQEMLKAEQQNIRLLSPLPKAREQEARSGFWRRVFGRR